MIKGGVIVDEEPGQLGELGGGRDLLGGERDTRRMQSGLGQAGEKINTYCRGSCFIYKKGFKARYGIYVITGPCA